MLRFQIWILIEDLVKETGGEIKTCSCLAVKLVTFPQEKFLNKVTDPYFKTMKISNPMSHRLPENNIENFLRCVP